MEPVALVPPGLGLAQHLRCGMHLLDVPRFGQRWAAHLEPQLPGIGVIIRQPVDMMIQRMDAGRRANAQAARPDN